MINYSIPSRPRRRALILFLLAIIAMLPGQDRRCLAAESPMNPIRIGIAQADVTPELPIWLAGYAARRRPADQVDHPLRVQAMAMQSQSGPPFVFVALDNCEVSRRFNQDWQKSIQQDPGLPPERVMIVSSHTHSAPVLLHTLESMYQMPNVDQERVRKYGVMLGEKIVAVVKESIGDLKPARLEFGRGRTSFAMNRRIYRPGGMAFGENPDGPVDWDVPVLKILGVNDQIRAILFGYACHGTSISGEDFHIVSGDYMAYARDHLESLYPGATALYMTGMGADSNPSPRGSLLDAKRHGMKLAGAVLDVLDHPMRPVDGGLKFAYRELKLPLEEPPSMEQLKADTESDNRNIRERARIYLDHVEAGHPVSKEVPLPVSVLRIGDDLTFINMAGEVVADYAVQFKRLYASDHPWLIGYAYEVPCYIPSMRLLKEGGYEADSSLIYYGFYGPFKGEIEGMILGEFDALLNQVR